MDWNCPECGHLNDEEMNRCICGYEINEEITYLSQKSFSDMGKIEPQPLKQEIAPLNKTHGPLPRRFGAFIIDIIIIGVFGQILSIGLTSQLTLLGDKGPFIGLFVLLLYFGIGNSKVFNGQTLGKSVMKIAVERIDGKKLSVSFSILRSSTYIVPFLFNGWALDLGQSGIAKLFWVIIGSWLFSYIISLLIFVIGNWSSGRLFQDILLKTRVGQEDNDKFSSNKKERALSVITVAIFAGLFTLGAIRSNNVKEPEYLKQIADFHQIMMNEFPDFKFGVNLNHLTGEEAVDILTIRAFPRMLINDGETDHYTNVFASKALIEFRKIEDVDFLFIGITKGFHIGIANRSMTSWERWSVGKWRKKLGIIGNYEQGENKKLPFVPSLMR